MVNSLVTLRRVGLAMCALAPLAISVGISPIATAAPQDAGNSSDASDRADWQNIQRRLDEQENEIQWLRQELAARGAGVSLPETLPDVSAAQSDESKPTITDLEDQINTLEKKLNTSAALKDVGSNSDPALTGPYEVGSDLKMNATWKNGVVFESAHKDFRMHIGGRVQWDISAFDNDPALLAAPAVGGIGPQPDSTQFRRARVRADGTMYEVFDCAT